MEKERRTIKLCNVGRVAVEKGYAWKYRQFLDGEDLQKLSIADIDSRDSFILKKKLCGVGVVVEVEQPDDNSVYTNNPKHIGTVGCQEREQLQLRAKAVDVEINIEKAAAKEDREFVPRKTISTLRCVFRDLRRDRKAAFLAWLITEIQ